MTIWLSSLNVNVNVAWSGDTFSGFVEAVSFTIRMVVLGGTVGVKTSQRKSRFPKQKSLDSTFFHHKTQRKKEGKFSKWIFSHINATQTSGMGGERRRRREVRMSKMLWNFCQFFLCQPSGKAGEKTKWFFTPTETKKRRRRFLWTNTKLRIHFQRKILDFFAA